MRIHVVNLERRPDRRAAMELQAARLGLSFDYVPAVDAAAMPERELRRNVRRGPLGDLTNGDIGCFLSHREVWRRLLAGPDAHAVVLEDDAHLADDAATLLGNDGWVPAGEKLVKLERYGRSRILVGRQVADLAGRSGRRLYSKSAGSAAYLISREGAALALGASESFDVPVDHFLFNPSNSPLFAQLTPLHVSPAPVEQDRMLHSDLPRDRAGLARLRRHFGRELGRGYYELRLLPRAAWLLATRQAELLLPAFGPAGSDR